MLTPYSSISFFHEPVSASFFIEGCSLFRKTDTRAETPAEARRYSRTEGTAAGFLRGRCKELQATLNNNTELYQSHFNKRLNNEY
ncbi:hypothetical protein C6Y45_06220 [Alkalicoccus saliphilus]|uniref:Uncharacterized protein n=1 Tax=Alkalicoccus saliphilus TaxID=200989 RepID=A0A2T4U7P4_9BACI|nr:hypothetical protein C6Y45_06220 [Alkalicoccus saliphilus]